MLDFIGFLFRLLAVLPAMILFSFMFVAGWILHRIGDVGKIVKDFALTHGSELSGWIDGPIHRPSQELEVSSGVSGESLLDDMTLIDYLD